MPRVLFLLMGQLLDVYFQKESSHTLDYHPEILTRDDMNGPRTRDDMNGPRRHYKPLSKG